MGKGSDGKREGREGEERREEGRMRKGGKQRGSSHAFCFLNLGSSGSVGRYGDGGG